MIPHQVGPSGRATRRVYDADEVDAYIPRLHATAKELQDRLDAAHPQFRSPHPMPAPGGPSESVLARTLLTAEREADDIVAAAHEQAGQVLALATDEAEACMLGAGLEAERLVNQARHAIDAFLKNWDDQLCNQVSEARRRMFGGLGLRPGRRDVGAIENGPPARGKGHPHRRGGAALRMVTPPSHGVGPWRSSDAGP